MNSMGDEWVILGQFKAKEFYIATGADEVAHLYHKPPCDTSLANIDFKTLPEILDIVAAHRCPTIYGEK